MADHEHHHGDHGHHGAGHGHHGAGHGHHGAGHGHQATAEDEQALADVLDLDVDAVRTSWEHIWGRVQEAVVGAPARVVDLGAGTGTHSVELARRFPSAEIVAVDTSEVMMTRIAARAAAEGLGDRVRPVLADVDDGWPDTGETDVVWASMSLHHVGDPDRTLREAFAALRPGGVLAVVEFDEPLRFLPVDLGTGRPGLEDRALAVLREAQARQVPELGSVWVPRLAAAGFTVERDEPVAIDVTWPHPEGTARYAAAWLGRLRAAVADQVDTADAEAFAALLDGGGPHTVLQRRDLHVRGTRTITIARR